MSPAHRLLIQLVLFLTLLHTYVIVVVVVIVVLMDDQFFHCEILFSGVIGLIGGALPQVHRQTLDVSPLTAQKPNTLMINTHK